MLRMDERPQIDFEQEIRGHGVLLSGPEEIPAPDFLLKRSKYGTRGVWDVRVHVNADDLGRPILLLDVEPLELRGRSDEGWPVHVDEVHVDQYSQRRMEGWCYEVEVGPDSLPDRPDHQFVSITFSQTSVAQPEVLFPLRTHKGELKSTEGQETEPFRIPTTLDEGKFALKFEWEDANVGGNRASVRVPQPTLWLKIDDDQARTKPLDLVQQLEDDLKWFERLLSFFSRKHVSWLRAYVLSRWEEDAPVDRPQETRRWRTGVVGDPSTETVVRPFVVPGRMDGEDLGELLESLRALDYAEFVFHAIGHLIGAVSDRFVEGQMMNVFTALESVVSGWCRAHNREFIVDADPHNDIRPRVKRELEDAVEAHPAIPK